MVRILACKSMARGSLRTCGLGVLALAEKQLTAKHAEEKPRSSQRKSRSSYYQRSILLDGMWRLCVTKRLMSLRWVVRAAVLRNSVAAAFVLGISLFGEPARAQSITPAAPSQSGQLPSQSQ